MSPLPERDDLRRRYADMRAAYEASPEMLLHRRILQFERSFDIYERNRRDLQKHLDHWAEYGLFNYGGR